MTDYMVAIGLILARLKANDFRSWDHYDFWGSKTGIFLRENKSITTMPVIGAAYLLDVVFPMLFRRNVDQEISMETLVYVMRAMRVYKWATGDDMYENDRARLLKHMIAHLGTSPHGKGVGHQFDWYTTALIPKYTPCVTLSSYLVDYLLEEDPDRYADILMQIGCFVYHDLNLAENPDGSRKVAYTPLDNRWVINANSYAARIMMRLGAHFARDEYTALSEKLFLYVLNRQEDDGSWFYFEKGSVPEKENFIDCFHTAFILENLMGAVETSPLPHMAAALDRGLEYFAKTFARPDGAVNHFSKSHLPLKIRADIRSSAEAIACLAMASRRNPEYRETATKIHRAVMQTMHDGAGGFYFRDYGFHLSRMNYVRWGAAPMLNALCALSQAEGK